jgi:hypothetical protein
MRRKLPAVAVMLLGVVAALVTKTAARPRPPAQATAVSGAVWSFAVSGDSRNCGDVVMPAIAAGVKADHADFYWHLGDFRAIYTFDEDIEHQPEHLNKPLTISDYEDLAWTDFIDSQLAPFGSTPVFLALGNHETVPPKNRDELLPTFADWFNTPVISHQRLLDDPHDHRMRTYYHWIERGIAFYTLDNATTDQFDPDQLAWFQRVLKGDSADSAVKTIVVGMHEALPDSISEGHSMADFPAGTESGRRVYGDLLTAQNVAHKHVYVLASHSHYFMDGTFNTPYWRAHGGVLPGWIIGTAGAVRYALPPEAKDARAAQTNVYGYLLATVQPSGEIRFDFKKLAENDLKSALGNRYQADFIHWCYTQNSQAR